MKNLFNNVLKDEDFEYWFSQFEDEDKPIIYKLLSYYQYYTSDKVFEMLNKLYTLLVDEFHIDIDTTLFIPIGYTAKSGSAITYFFKRENNLDEDKFIAMNDLRNEDFHRVKTIIFLDDFIGSGEYLESIKKDFINKLSDNIKKRVQFICACLVGYEQGIDKVNGDILKVCVVQKITYNYQPLHKDSIIFSANEKQAAETVLYKYNKPLKPKHPLGYGDIQGLVSFFFATPNNTLPIFWSSNNDWHPLFPRGDSRRNPNRLITLPDFLVEHKVFSSEFNSKIKISDKITRSLYNSFMSLDKMNIMAEIFSHLNIEEDLILNILYALENYQNMKHEKNPVCTSLFVIDSKSEENVCNELIVDAVNLSFDSENFKNHLMLIDGWSNTLVLDHKGKVLGILNYLKNRWDTISKYKSDKYLPIEYTSYIYHGLIIVFTDNDRILIYYNGNRLMTKKERDWHVQGNLRNIADMAISHNIVPAVLDRALELAFKLSDIQEGALLCVGDENNVNNYANKMGNLQFSFRERNIMNADEKVLVSLASQDGATIISSNGEIKNAMVRLEPPRDIEVKSETGKGTRHNTAKKMSAITNSIYITVSSDGPISVYIDGERVLRMLG